VTTQFRGSIGRTWQESKPWWPQPTRAPPDAPNIALIILDDVGYGWLSCYGGPIETPNIDGLARNGLLYNNWHTTALCSPTRATLLTGRNHHSVSTGTVTDMATGFPGYDGRIPKEKATIAAALRKYGYNTFAVGKWHNTPAGETGPEGPFDRWPTGEMMGFDRFYGFLGGGCNQWYPPLVWDNHPISPSKAPEEGYHLSVDLVDKAILFISNHESVAPEKQWFLWLAFGAAHAPHHVSKEWADRYKGKFDQGWDKVREETLRRQKSMGIVPQNTELAPPNEGVQKWDDLSADEKKLFTRMMEVYAGFLSHTDHQIGRLIAFLREINNIDNTMMFVCSDNGASAEGMLTGLFNEASVFNMEPESTEENMKRIDELGSPTSYNHYPVGWAMAGDAPFKWYKQYTHYGGTKDPLIVHWPNGIRDRGKIRTQFHHSVDIVPTIFEAVGLDPPAEIGGYTQAPLEGVSMFYSFNDDAMAPSRKKIQYFEMLGNRAIWYNGWKAVAYHGRLPWENNARWSFDEDKWELYNVQEDFSECKDLADKHPEKLRQLVELWWAEAGKYNVLPLDDRFSERVVARAEIDKEKKSYTFYPGTARVPEGSAPHFKNRSYTINAEVEIPEGGAEGPICAIGGIGGGWSLYVKDNKLVYCYNYLGKYFYYLRSTDDIPAGKVNLGLEFEKTGKEKFGAGGAARLYINRNKAGELNIPRTVRFVYSLGESFDIGRDSGTVVTPEYKNHAEFTGTIKKVMIDLAGEKHIDSEAEARMSLVQE
jgi:arylsulfatase A-like enzyme